MSRSITIVGTYFNGQTVQRGRYSYINAEYKESRIGYTCMFQALQQFKDAIKGKRLKDLKMMHCISSGSSDDYIRFTYDTPALTDFEMVRQVDMNNAAYTAFID